MNFFVYEVLRLKPEPIKEKPSLWMRLKSLLNR